MKFLVTGGTGFLGLYLVERLANAGMQVRAFGRREIPELNRPNVEFFRGDIRSRADCTAACRGIDAVFHTAALTGIGLDRHPYYETNVTGTENLLTACRAAGIQKLVYTGSPSATDSGHAQEGVDESAPYPKKFLAYYPETKAIAEQLVLSADGASLPDGSTLSTCSLRPRLIWGPRDRNLIPRLIDKARAGRLVRVGDGTNRLDMIYVENAADAHIKAMNALSPESPVAGNAYFLSQGDPVNCWDFINRVLALAHLEPVAKSISFKTAWRIGGIYEALYRLFRMKSEPPMTRFLATQLAFSYWFDTSRARRDFGFVPTITIDEGLRRLAIYFQNNQ